MSKLVGNILHAPTVPLVFRASPYADLARDDTSYYRRKHHFATGAPPCLPLALQIIALVCPIETLRVAAS
jgi:hypothetical protein